MAKKKSKNVVVVTVVVVVVICNCMYSQKSQHRQRILRSRCEQTAEKDERPLWRLPLMIEVALACGCTLSIAPDQTRHSPRHIPFQFPPELLGHALAS